METTTLMNEGLTLMLFGMGFVFIFLTVLVFATSAMSWAVIKYEKNVGVLPEDGVPSPTAVIPHHDHDSSQKHETQDAAIIPVISAAVKKFRSKNK